MNKSNEQNNLVINSVTIKDHRTYGNSLKGIKIYYEGKRPKRLSKDGKINFGKNILEILKTRFEKFHWIITTDKDNITLERGIYRVRTSLKTLNSMFSEQLNRNHDIKVDIIKNRFSTIYPSYFTNRPVSPYVPGKLADVLYNITPSRLSSADKDALNNFLPDFIASESVTAINLLKASTQIKTLKELADELKNFIGANYSESSWQKYIQNNILIIQQGYIKAIEKMNIAIGDTKFPDFSLITHDGYLDILEIKKPTTNLIKLDEGRGNYYWDSEISKALIQVENYIANVSRFSDAVRSYIFDKYKIPLKVVRPRGIILAGDTRKFSTQKEKDDFRLISQSVKNIVFVSYDELLDRLNNYIGVLEDYSKIIHKK